MRFEATVVRMKRVCAVAICIVATSTIGASAFAASSARSPADLVLRKSDFPSNAIYDWGRLPPTFATPLGIKADAAYLSVRIPVRGTNFVKAISGIVVATASTSQARTFFRASKADLRRNRSVLRLPSYGDEQLASFESKNASRVEILVRRNTVVWQLGVDGSGLRLPRAALVAELRRYAAKQKRRVGAG